MSKGIIGIYCRVSSDSQKDGYSLDTQSEDGRKWCIENGYSNEVFIDIISGKSTKRDGFAIKVIPPQLHRPTQPKY